MSKIGRKLIEIPTECKVEVKDGKIFVKGPKGELNWQLLPQIDINISEKNIAVKKMADDKQTKSYHGLSRTLINNMIIGVTKGYTKKLALVWKGGKLEVKNGALEMNVNFIKKKYHPIEGVKIEQGKPADAKITGIDRTRIPGVVIVSGIDKQKVGAVAAKIRSFLPPEPYHGRGIRYLDEVVKTKPGKTGAGA